MSDRTTIVIVARNAAATIERAIRSCLFESGCPIVLIDDHSVDDTVMRAVAHGGNRLQVVRTDGRGGLAAARQAGLEAVDTEFAAWLDADDEWIEGRADRLETLLRSGCDIATEAIDLWDGPSNRWLRTLTIPAFLARRGGAVRLFERNFLPGDAAIAFRAAVLRDIGGFDPAIAGPEFDLLLRALRAGARLGFGERIGYRIYAYPRSASRDLPRQRAGLATALRKHPYDAIDLLYRQAGYDERVAAWAQVSMALYRGEFHQALRFVEAASPAAADPEQVIEPDGPWPQCEGWRRAFARGTALLLVAEPIAAIAELRRAESLDPAAESGNNLGVALWRTGAAAAARACFAGAIARWPGYADAHANLLAADPGRITTHPLRREPSRTDYDLQRQAPSTRG